MPRRYDSKPLVLIPPSGGGPWRCFERPRRLLCARSVHEIKPVLEHVQRAIEKEHLHAAGWIAYEAASAFDEALTTHTPGPVPLLWFGIFDAPEPCDFDPFEVPPPQSLPDWQPDTEPEDYRRAVRLIREYIAMGDTYQANYTYRLQADCREDPLAIFAHLYRAQPTPCAAFISTDDFSICSASPELFLAFDGKRIRSRPMKGTALRGRTLEEDHRMAAHLDLSKKDRAENLMIVDMVRNDLGRVAQTGSVDVTALFALEKYPTVWQMTSTVEAVTDASFSEILAALFPPASITGAPKCRTMEIITELETSPRGVYTGAVGHIGPGMQGWLNVAIRTVTMNHATQTAEYGVGGGIVWDSDPERELAETRAKAAILNQAPPRFDLLETLLWQPGEGYALLDRHLRRLRESAEYFGRTLDEGHVRKMLEAGVAVWQEPRRVRLLVDAQGAARIESVLLAPSAGNPVRLGLSRTPVDPDEVFLYHKTTHRDVYEKRRAECGDCDDVILFNTLGEVTETTIGNVVVEIDGHKVTPPVSCGLLPGTQRAEMLKNRQVVERIVRVEDLRRAERIWRVNSVRGMELSILKEVEDAV